MSSKYRLYDYVIIGHPADGDEDSSPELLNRDIAGMFAKSEKEVVMKASRDIPDEWLDKLDRVEIAVRPF